MDISEQMNTSSSQEVSPFQIFLGAALGAGALLLGLEVQRRLSGRRKVSFKLNESSDGQRLPSGRQLQSNGTGSPLTSPPYENELIQAGRWTGSQNSVDRAGTDTQSEVTSTPARFSSTITESTSGPLHHSSFSVGQRSSQTTSASGRDVEDHVLQLLFEIAKSQTQSQAIIHRGISCNMCECNPLKGVRFKCLNCVDYDVCERCEPNSYHDENHVLAKIKVPIPPLCNPRKALLPVFYPGKREKTEPLSMDDKIFLSEVSHFDPTEIDLLHEQYLSLCTQKSGITRDTFNQCLGPLSIKKNLVVEQLFRFYDEDGDGYIGFSDFIHGLSVLSKGTQKEKIAYAFKGYDVDGDGFVSKDDLLHMFRAYHVLSMELVRDVIKSCEEEMMATFDDSSSRPISSVFNAPIPDSGNAVGLLSQRESKSSSVSEVSTVDPALLGGGRHFLVDTSVHRKRFPAVEAMTQDAIIELADTIMNAADLDADGKLSEDEFKRYCSVDTHLMAWFDAVGTVF